MNSDLWQILRGDSPLVATAIHDGHDVRDEVARLLALDDTQRRREEDPGTGVLADIADTRIVVRRSRFEVDPNRPRHQAVYLCPEDAWGLNVWKEAPSKDIIARSLRQYDAFYAEAAGTLTDLAQRHGRLILLDLHAYNHRRGGPDAPPGGASGNPEVDIEMEPADRSRWAPVMDRLMHDLRRVDFMGRRLDVRENVRFKPGNFARWVNAAFPDSVCAIAVEFKKLYMDEWTGEINGHHLQALATAMQSVIPGVMKELKAL